MTDFPLVVCAVRSEECGSLCMVPILSGRVVFRYDTTNKTILIPISFEGRGDNCIIISKSQTLFAHRFLSLQYTLHKIRRPLQILYFCVAPGTKNTISDSEPAHEYQDVRTVPNILRERDNWKIRRPRLANRSTECVECPIERSSRNWRHAPT